MFKVFFFFLLEYDPKTEELCIKSLTGNLLIHRRSTFSPVIPFKVPKIAEST